MPEPDRRERKRAKTRQALLDAALRLIAERGIYGTRVEDITERTDLGKGAFYNYFESKDSLIAELVSRGVTILHDRYLSAPPDSLSSAQRVAAVVAAHDAFFSEHPVFVVLFHQARGLAKMRTSAHSALSEVFVEYLRRTALAVVAPEDRDRFGADDLLDVAAVILGAIAGYRSFRLAADLGVVSSVVAEVLAVGAPATLAVRARPGPSAVE